MNFPFSRGDVIVYKNKKPIALILSFGEGHVFCMYNGIIVSTMVDDSYTLHPWMGDGWEKI
jgi:hypothetical protein